MTDLTSDFPISFRPLSRVDSMLRKEGIAAIELLVDNRGSSDLVVSASSTLLPMQHFVFIVFGYSFHKSVPIKTVICKLLHSMIPPC